MKTIPVFFGVIKESEDKKRYAKFDNPEKFQTYLKQIPLDKKVIITVEIMPEDVTKRMVGYYRGVLLPFASDELGLNIKEMHKHFVENHLKDPDSGKIRSTGKLQKYEYWKFINDVIQELCEGGYNPPRPHDSKKPYRSK